MDLYERGLAQLAPADFDQIAQKCKRAVVQPSADRMYEPLFNLLDEIWGYLLLRSEAYEAVHFTPAGVGAGETPEACGHRGGRVGLIEVKSFRDSADDREAMDPKSNKFRARDGNLDPDQESEDSKPGGIFYRLGARINDERTRQLSYKKASGSAEPGSFACPPFAPDTVALP